MHTLGINNFSRGALWTQNSAIVSERMQGVVKLDALTYQVALAFIFATQFNQLLKSKGRAMPTLVYIGVGVSPWILCMASELSSEKNKEYLNTACYQFSSWITLATYSVLAGNLFFKNYHLFIPFVLGMGTRKLLSQPIVSAIVGDQLNAKLMRSLWVVSSILTFLTAEGALMWLFSLYADIFPIIEDGLNFGAELYPQLMSGYRHPAIEENRDKTLQDFVDGVVQLDSLVIDPTHFKKEIKGFEVKDVGAFHQQLNELKAISEGIEWRENTQINWIHEMVLVDGRYQTIIRPIGEGMAWVLALAIDSCDQAKDSHFVEDVAMLSPGAHDYHNNAKGFFIEGLEILCWRVKKKGAEVWGEVFKEEEPTLQIRKKDGLARDIICSDIEEFKKLEKMLEEIANYIANNPKKEESIHTLIHLGVYGNYCGIRIFDVVRKVRHDLLGERLGAEELLDHDLDKNQDQFLSSIEKKLVDTKWSEYFLAQSFSDAVAILLFLGSYWDHYFEAQNSKGTPHNQEYFRYLYGGPIGLNLKRVFIDQGSRLPERVPHWKSIREESQRFYTEYYTSQALTERYQQVNQIPWEAMEKWFQEQGHKDPREYFDADENHWKPGAIKYFLYKQGVLGIKTI